LPGNLVVRIVQVAFGLLVAGAVAALFLSFGYVRDAAGPAFGRATEFRADSLLTAVFAILIGPALFKALLAPAAVAIALAELAALRGLVANLALGGMLALFAGWRAFEPEPGLSRSGILVLLAAGFVAGFVYWAIAGRHAGNWLRRPRISDPR
jgi:hypothetical protein